jgi:hypothetical protein
MNIRILIKEIINEISREEIIDNDYEEDNPDQNTTSYRFKTQSQTKYALYFDKENKYPYNIKIENKYYLDDLLKDEFKEYNFIEIGYSLDREDNLNPKKVSDLEFNKKTNLFETKELYGKIIFFINKYIDKIKNADIFIISKETVNGEDLNVNRKRLSIYLDIFKNSFSNKYKLFNGKDNENYNYYFFINKNLLKNEYI